MSNEAIICNSCEEVISGVAYKQVFPDGSSVFVCRECRNDLVGGAKHKHDAAKLFRKVKQEASIKSYRQIKKEFKRNKRRAEHMDRQMVIMAREQIAREEAANETNS